MFVDRRTDGCRIGFGLVGVVLYGVGAAGDAVHNGNEQFRNPECSPAILINVGMRLSTSRAQLSTPVSEW